jgi:hypothetical protein
MISFDDIDLASAADFVAQGSSEIYSGDEERSALARENEGKNVRVMPSTWAWELSQYAHKAGLSSTKVAEAKAWMSRAGSRKIEDAGHASPNPIDHGLAGTRARIQAQAQPRLKARRISDPEEDPPNPKLPRLRWKEFVADEAGAVSISHRWPTNHQIWWAREHSSDQNGRAAYRVMCRHCLDEYNELVYVDDPRVKPRRKSRRYKVADDKVFYGLVELDDVRVDDEFARVDFYADAPGADANPDEIDSEPEQGKPLTEREQRRLDGRDRADRDEDRKWADAKVRDKSPTLRRVSYVTILAGRKAQAPRAAARERWASEEALENSRTPVIYKDDKPKDRGFMLELVEGLCAEYGIEKVPKSKPISKKVGRPKKFRHGLIPMESLAKSAKLRETALYMRGEISREIWVDGEPPEDPYHEDDLLGARFGIGMGLRSDVWFGPDDDEPMILAWRKGHGTVSEDYWGAMWQRHRNFAPGGTTACTSAPGLFLAESE